MKILLTGGAGFIGSALVRYLIKHTPHTVINIDKLTYAGNLTSLAEVLNNDRHTFEKADICSFKEIRRIFLKYQPNLVIHLAAETHVDRSIDGPAAFIQTNILGTYTLLEVVRAYWQSLNQIQRQLFRFHHVSTDEVYGDLGNTNLLFSETTPYAPSSPYSASKASADHLVRAWFRTYGIPVLITNCSNNYGPYQFPEKFIPVMILHALAGKPLEIYGDGKQIRDWLYVEDHVRGLYKVATEGKVGETYNIGGCNEKTNISVLLTICDLLEMLAPKKPNGVNSYRDLIKHIKDRPGHDRRYAIDSSKIKNELSWAPQESHEYYMRKTVEWYINNKQWCQRVRDRQFGKEKIEADRSEQLV